MGNTSAYLDISKLPLSFSIFEELQWDDTRVESFCQNDSGWTVYFTEEEAQRYQELFSKVEKNNYNHIFKINNSLWMGWIDNIHTEDYIQDFSLKIFARTDRGKISPNSLDLTFKISRGDELEKVDDFNNLFKKGDKISLIDTIFGTEFNSFTGELKEVSRQYRNTNRTYGLKAYDKTYSMLEKKVLEDEILVDYWVCNNTDKDKSLLHQFAYRCGFQDSELDFEDSVYKDGSGYIKIPFLHLKTKTRYSDEVAELVRAVNSDIFVDMDSKLVFKRGYDTFSDANSYFFDEQNILNEINVVTKTTDKNAVKVGYTNYKILENQTIFELKGENATESDAMIVIPVDTTAENNNVWWKIQYPSGIAKNVSGITATGYYFDEAEQKVPVSLIADTHYEAIYDQAGGKVRFFNPLSYGLHIEKFEISGEPVLEFEGNEYKLVKKGTPEETEEILELTNKYIQSRELAKEFCEYNYIENCMERDELTFDSNLVMFMQPLYNCDVNHVDYVGKIQILEMTHTKNKSRIKAVTYQNVDLTDASREELISGNKTGGEVVRSSEVISLEKELRDKIEALDDRITALGG